MPLEFLRLPVVALAGFLLYAESFELEILLGALIIFSGNYISLWYETRRGRPHAPPAASPNTTTKPLARQRPCPPSHCVSFSFASADPEVDRRDGFHPHRHTSPSVGPWRCAAQRHP